MNYKIALIRGDGIGPEVVGEAVKVMEAIGEKFGHTFTYTDVLMGGCAIDAVGKSYPDGTAEACKACDAVLLGAVGGPKWGHASDPEKRPETALLSIRRDLGLYANLPLALSTAMGSNFILGGLVNSGTVSFGWAMALLLCSGILFILVTVLGVRKMVVDLLPKNLKQMFIS